jgi:hypothetical protein
MLILQALPPKPCRMMMLDAWMRPWRHSQFAPWSLFELCWQQGWGSICFKHKVGEVLEVLYSMV